MPYKFDSCVVFGSSWGTHIAASASEESLRTARSTQSRSLIRCPPRILNGALPRLAPSRVARRAQRRAANNGRWNDSAHVPDAARSGSSSPVPRHGSLVRRPGPPSRTRASGGRRGPHRSVKTGQPGKLPRISNGAERRDQPRTTAAEMIPRMCAMPLEADLRPRSLVIRHLSFVRV